MMATPAASRMPLATAAPMLRRVPRAPALAGAAVAAPRLPRGALRGAAAAGPGGRVGAVAAAAAGASSSTPVSSGTTFHYLQIEVETAVGVGLYDITPQIRAAMAERRLEEGFVTVLSRHTTTAVTINEAEPRLMDDVRQWLRTLAPPAAPYLHNDLHLRAAPDGWPGGHAAWAAQEPINAHSHLLSMMLGNSFNVPVAGGNLCIGQWQSVMLVELDGPRRRTVGLQLVGNARS